MRGEHVHLSRVGDALDVGERQAERLQRENLIEPPEIVERVAAMAGGVAPRREQAAALVVPQRLQRDAGELGERARRVRHGDSLDPAPGAESSGDLARVAGTDYIVASSMSR